MGNVIINILCVVGIFSVVGVILGFLTFGLVKLSLVFLIFLVIGVSVAVALGLLAVFGITIWKIWRFLLSIFGF